MPKYKIAVGTCGPTILYETCSGSSKEDAVRKIIDEMHKGEYDSWELDEGIKRAKKESLGEEYIPEEFVPKPDSYWENLYEKYLKHTEEVKSVNKPEIFRLTDFLGQEIHVNDSVAFIRNKRTEPTKLMYGTVEKITGKGIVTKASDGEKYQVMLSTSNYLDKTKLLKVIVLKERPDRTGEVKDATGYPVHVGDKIAFMGKVVRGASQAFELAVVKKISNNTAFFDVPVSDYLGGGTKESRRSLDRLVVL